MPRKFTPKIITTNDLMLGDVIYLTDDDGWTRALGRARLFRDQEEAERVLAVVDRWRNIHVGAYLADAEPDELGKPKPLHFRERFRATGPSNYFHGKQAERNHVRL